MQKKLADDSLCIHAGTKRSDANAVVTNGGRVIAVTSFGTSIPEAAQQSMASAERIKYEGKYYRKDIGKDVL